MRMRIELRAREMDSDSSNFTSSCSQISSIKLFDPVLPILLVFFFLSSLSRRYDTMIYTKEWARPGLELNIKLLRKDPLQIVHYLVRRSAPNT